MSAWLADHSVMQELSEHYGALLGLDDHWCVAEVDLALDQQRVTLRLQAVADARCCCPDCGRGCPLKDHAPERSWRHLDTMQFQTVLVARVPRANCPSCGVKTCSVPWARPHGRFTLMFEAFAIRVLQATSSIERARSLLGLGWEALHRIMQSAVERGLEARDLDGVTRVGIDEKNFRRGHSYVSVLSDHDGQRVLEVVEGRDCASVDGLCKPFTAGQLLKVRSGGRAVSLDMWQAFENSVNANLPHADIVHDRFHIMQHLGEAIDRVRRREHRQLKQQGDDTLTGTKYLWLSNPENISDQRWPEFESLKQMHLKTARAWAIREQFNFFWDYRYRANAKKFFDRWYRWASRCQLTPVREKAKMIRRRLGNILTYFKHRITNGPAEGFNSRIQSIKSAARGFRNFDNYRIRILFFCGKLQLMPRNSH